MGDIQSAANCGGDLTNPEPPTATHQGTMPENAPTHPQSTSFSDASAFQGQYQQLYAPTSNSFSSQLDMPISGRQGPYDMSAMANALPQSGYRPGYAAGQQQQRYTPPGPNMMPQMVQFSGQPHMSQLTNQQYYLSQHQQIPHYYNAQMSPTAQPNQAGLSQTRAGMGMGFYPNSVMMNQSQASVPGYYYPPSNQFSVQNPSMLNHLAQSQYLLPDGSSADPRVSSPQQNNNNNRGFIGGFTSNEEPSGNRPNIVRGPPRKPRQSGHAIWIGNLPPQTDLMSLVHHVCKEAAGLESLFLISKSNCAFANFKDETSCIAAQQKLHDSKFQSVRLVSRLRKSTVEGTSGQTAPTGPAATSPSGQPTSSDPPSSSPNKSTNPSKSTVEDGVATKNIPADGTQQKDKFFILKSLTVEDLELSIQNGVWATQSHNEEALNEAYGAVDNVYLIFSANKSGEYFGYAKMISPINHDPAAAIEFAPKAQATSSVDLPKAIPTEATETCPRGRIIDDSARGTIFWELERDEADGVSDTISEDSESARSISNVGEGGTNAWGKPFKLEWLSTTRLPFYRTRGLRNPWNSNREVKIARDGTELEPTVGRKLIGLFNRIQSPAPVLAMGMTAGIATGYSPLIPPQFRQ